MADILAGLNPAQQRAVQIIDGPALVLAGPGSGKTGVLTRRVAYLTDVIGVDLHNILAVTFTNKAAREMRERIDALLGEGRGAALTAGTFHSLCARFLRRDIVHLGRERDFVIYDSDDQQRLMKRVLKDLNLDEKKNPPRAIHAQISSAKNELVDAQEYARLARTLYEETAARCYKRYQELLREANALDFDDLLVETVRLFEQHPAVLDRYQERYRYILADEYQDTNRAQYVLLKQLAAKYRNLFVVGDEDQGIYAFRGADIRNIRSFEADYPEAQIMMLEQNYRSTQAILDVAQSVINRAHKRVRAKTIWTDNDKGTLVTLQEAFDENEEGRIIALETSRLIQQGEARPSEVAVMYRTNAQSRAIEESLIQQGLPYVIIGGTKFYERKEVKDVLAYLRLVHNQHDSVGLQRALNWPPRGIGARTEEDLARFATDQGLPLYRALELIDAPERTIADVPVPFAGKTRAALLGFLQIIQTMLRAKEQQDLGELMDTLFTLIDVESALIREHGEEEGRERYANVVELRNIAVNYVNIPRENQLAAFLEDVALVSEVDNVGTKGDAITCITLHQAKGLEYPVVFLVGLEDGVIPHSRSLDDQEALDEERRLFYVGATRAKRRLYLLYAFRRTAYGRTNISTPSRFLGDIPKPLLHMAPKRSTATLQTSMFSGRSTVGDTQQRTKFMPAAPAPQQTRARLERPSNASFFAGMKVRHAVFGDGVVITSAITEDDEEVTVAFSGKGVKKLLASFAGLQKVES